MEYKIVFIVSNINLPRCVNRVNEFIKKGYEVEVYFFDRPLYENKREAISAPMHSLGTLESGGGSYFRRIPAQYRKVKSVVDRYKGTKSIFYLFGFDMALVYSMCHNKCPYIFEESDLRHTYFKPAMVSRLLECVDKRIIKKSFITVFTSEGFFKYHFSNERVDNVCIIPNRLNPSIKFTCPNPRPRAFNPDSIRVGFVGSIRFKTVYNFVDVFCSSFPQHEFHFYGYPIQDNIEELNKYDNCFFHGAFSSPQDLPEIYSGLDLVLSTYDTDFENVKYAEPNKFYEAIYFNVPIIVSSDTFLADKVRRLNVGFVVDASKEEDIRALVSSLSEQEMESKRRSIMAIPKDDLLSINDSLFDMILSKQQNHE